jgi:uncharacterized protein (TIRG00374 family)
MPDAAARTRVPWSGLAVAALTIGLLYLLFRDVDLDQLLASFAAAHPGHLAVVIVVTLQTYLIRAWRWQALLAPLGRVRFRPAFRTTVIGFTATFLLPARVGEVLRPYLLARQEQLSPTATFATVIIERVLDLTAVLILFAVTMPFLGVEVGRETEVAGLVAAAGSVALLGVLFASAGHPERLGLLVDRCTRWLPVKLATLIGTMSRQFAEGLAVMRDLRAVALTLAWSLALWVSICLGIWLTSRAFDLTVPFLGSFLIVMYLVVGVSAPTPGGAGGFQFMYKLAVTQYFGATPEAGLAAGTVLHLVSIVPVIVLGLLFMWQDGLTLGSLKQMRTATGEDARP